MITLPTNEQLKGFLAGTFVSFGVFTWFTSAFIMDLEDARKWFFDPQDKEIKVARALGKVSSKEQELAKQIKSLEETINHFEKNEELYKKDIEELENKVDKSSLSLKATLSDLAKLNSKSDIELQKSRSELSDLSERNKMCIVELTEIKQNSEILQAKLDSVVRLNENLVNNRVGVNAESCKVGSSSSEDRVDTDDLRIIEKLEMRYRVASNIPNSLTKSDTLFEISRDAEIHGFFDESFRYSKDIPNSLTKSESLDILARKIALTGDIEKAMMVANHIPNSLTKSDTLQELSRF